MTAMASPPATARITPEDLLRHPDRNGYELVDGKLVERPVSIRSSEVGTHIASLFTIENIRTGGVKVFGADLGYQCFADDPDKVRKADASVVRADRLVGIPADRGYMPIVPDLAVEVLSPNDLSYKVTEKIEEYLAAGYPLVWAVDPKAKIVAIHRADGSVTKLYEGDEITGESAFPAFRCKVGDFFKT